VIHLQHIFHVIHKLAVGVRWDTPLLHAPWLELIFF
jgi:hypothetical protein